MGDGFDCPSIDGDDGDYDAGQKERGQFIDVFDTNEDHHGHQAEADGAVDSHIVQHGTVTPMGICGMEDGRLGNKVFLRREGKTTKGQSYKKSAMGTDT